MSQQQSSRTTRKQSAVVFCALAIVLLPVGCQLSPHKAARPSWLDAYGQQPTDGKVDASRAVPAEGWRRTKDGWEHTEMWAIEASGRGGETISELIDMQSQREPAWIRQGLGQLRSIPPHWIAIIQVLLIGVICGVSKRFQSLRQMN